MSEVLKAVTGIAALIAGKGKKEDVGHVDAKGIKLVSASAQLDRRKVDGSEDYEGHLMVSIEGSDRDFKRTPICTVLVLDVSTSMSGPKLALLKETARKVAQNLTDKDEIAIVAFGSHVETVLERTNAGNREPVLAAISRLQTTGCTNMSGGFQQGLRQVNEKFKGVKRIMLLTDGMANEGIQDREGLLGMAKDRDSCCTMSTFGFGTDCDQELLADMAKVAGGNYYFIDGKDIKNVFARELGGMLSCIGQNLQVRIRPNKGGEVLEVLNDFTVVDEGGEAVINAEDLFAGETKHVLVRFKVARPEGKPKARPFSAAHVEVSWDGVKSKRHEKIELNPKVTFVKARDADAEPVIEVAEQVALIDAANAQLAAVEAADRGDFSGARGILRGAEAMCMSLVDRGSHAAEGLRTTMRSSMKGFTASTYSAAFGSTVSNAAMNATKYRKGSGDDEAFLSSNVMGTRSMDALEANFTDDDGVNVDPPDMGGLPDQGAGLGGLPDNRVPVEPSDVQWTDGSGNPLTDLPSVDVPLNDTPCTGDHANCFCHACNCRRTVEHIENHPPFTAPGAGGKWKPGDKIGPIEPAKPRKGEVIHKVEDRKHINDSKFAKRSKRWSK